MTVEQGRKITLDGRGVGESLVPESVVLLEKVDAVAKVLTTSN